MIVSDSAEHPMLQTTFHVAAVISVAAALTTLTAVVEAVVDIAPPVLGTMVAVIAGYPLLIFRWLIFQHHGGLQDAMRCGGAPPRVPQAP